MSATTLMDFVSHSGKSAAAKAEESAPPEAATIFDRAGLLQPCG